MATQEGLIAQHPDTAAAVFECYVVSFCGALRERALAQLAICIVAEMTLRTSTSWVLVLSIDVVLPENAL